MRQYFLLLKFPEEIGIPLFYLSNRALDELFIHHLTVINTISFTFDVVHDHFSIWGKTVRQWEGYADGRPFLIDVALHPIAQEKASPLANESVTERRILKIDQLRFAL